MDACSGERQVDGVVAAPVNLSMALRQGMQYAVVWLAIRVDAHCGGRPRERRRGFGPERRSRPARAGTDDIANLKDSHARSGTFEPVHVHLQRQRGRQRHCRRQCHVGDRLGGTAGPVRRSGNRARGAASANPDPRPHEGQGGRQAVGDADQLRPVHGGPVRTGRSRSPAHRRFRSEQRLRPRDHPAGHRRRTHSTGPSRRIGDEPRTHRRRPALRQLRDLR